MHLLEDIYFSNLNIICTDGGFFVCPIGMDWNNTTPHKFSQNKFYFITKGRCKINIEGKEYVACAGDWFFIPSHTTHSYSKFSDEAFEKYWVHFELFPDAELFSILNLPHMINVSNEKEVYKLFKSFAKSNMESTPIDKITIKTCLFSLISKYISLAHTNEFPSKSISDNRTNEILQYINENLDKPMSVNSLAEKFHFHPNHFIRFFKNEVGQTPAKYIKIRKLESAKNMLEYTDLYVNEIMERIGETDQSQFSKQFKSFYSFSPREYRKYFRNNL